MQRTGVHSSDLASVGYDSLTRTLERHAGECGYDSVPTVEPPLMRALQRAPWPNNLRELDSAIRRLLIEADLSPVLTLAHCPEALSHLRLTESSPLTRELMMEAISKHGGVSAAARALHVDRTTIHRRLRAPDADGA